MNERRKATVVAGLALFSMFFGAGNLIFPPLIGLISGDRFVPATIGFLLTSVGIVLTASVASTKSGGSVMSFSSSVGKGFSVVFSMVVILAIGPMLAIPRTAATTYEIFQGSLYPDLDPLLGSVIFFAVVLFFVLSPRNIIDILGKGLTPALIVVLAMILVKGVCSPLGTPVNTGINDAFTNGALEGYQTMDALAALIFTSIVGDGLRKKGFTEKKVLIHATIKAALFAGVGLAIVYGGLLYIGATLSGAGLADIDRVDLLIFATNSLLGDFGRYALSIAISLACLTTAIGLTTTVGNFFEKISGGKLRRVPVIMVSTLFSIYLSVKGVEAIVAIAGNVLTVIYPIAIVLIVLNLFPEKFPQKSTWRGAVFGAFLIPFLNLLNRLGLHMAFIDSLNSISEAVTAFIWIVPAFLFGLLFTKLKKC